jgi:hypothetical protein
LCALPHADIVCLARGLEGDALCLDSEGNKLNGYVNNRESSAAFHLCNEGTLVSDPEFVCDDGLHFNPEIGSCDLIGGKLHLQFYFYFILIFFPP